MVRAHSVKSQNPRGRASNLTRFKTYAKPISLLLILVSVMAVGFASGVFQALATGEVKEAIDAIVEGNALAAACVFFAATVLGCAFVALPGSAFAVIAAALFGPVVGTILCALSATCGAVVAFLLGRYFLRDAVRPKALRSRLLRKWLFSSKRVNDWTVLAVTRLVPVFPFNLQNFAYGITDIPLGTFAVATLVFIVPGTALYAFGAAGVIDADARIVYLGIACALLVLTFSMAFLLRKRYGIGVADASEASACVALRDDEGEDAAC